MKAITCEMCGSHDLVKQDGFFVCQYCGMKYSLEEAKKLYIEVSGSVKIDSSDDIKHLYTIARRARDEKSFVNAKKFYEQILVKEPSSWEASFYFMYCQSMCVNKENLYDVTVSVLNGINTIFSLISKNVSDANEQKKIVNEVLSKLIDCFNRFLDSNFATNIDYKYFTHCYNACLILSVTGDCLVKYFSKSYIKHACKCWKLFIYNVNQLINRNYLTGSLAETAVNEAEKCKNKILDYDSSYEMPLTLKYYSFFKYKVLLFLLLCLLVNLFIYIIIKLFL